MSVLVISIVAIVLAIASVIVVVMTLVVASTFPQQALAVNTECLELIPVQEKHIDTYG